MMYGFIHQKKLITSEMQSQFISIIHRELTMYNIPYNLTTTSSASFIHISTYEGLLCVTVNRKQILVWSQHDFETGCLLTDLVLNHVLTIFGELYTVIEQ
ncbi:hypothetical protein ABFG93_19080 [Pseudalkalibacillus hwajinpoensis]|uniref:hypothetical protein n=1 Tax=Guptibacillus hwajinpoensis TaxID=208199 RepID=UPI00325BB6ED